MEVKTWHVLAFLVFCASSSVYPMFLEDKSEREFYSGILNDIKSAFYHEGNFKARFMVSGERGTLRYLPPIHFRSDQAYALYAKTDPLVSQLSIKQQNVLCSFVRSIEKIAMSFSAHEQLWPHDFDELGNRFKADTLKGLLNLAHFQTTWEEAFPPLLTQQALSPVAEVDDQSSSSVPTVAISEQTTMSFVPPILLEQERGYSVGFFAPQPDPRVLDVQFFCQMMDTLQYVLRQDVILKLKNRALYETLPIFVPFQFSRSVVLRHSEAEGLCSKINEYFLRNIPFWQEKIVAITVAMESIYQQSSKVESLGFVQMQEFFDWELKESNRIKYEMYLAVCIELGIAC